MTRLQQFAAFAIFLTASECQSTVSNEYQQFPDVLPCMVQVRKHTNSDQSPINLITQCSNTTILIDQSQQDLDEGNNSSYDPTSDTPQDPEAMEQQPFVTRSINASSRECCLDPSSRSRPGHIVMWNRVPEELRNRSSDNFSDLILVELEFHASSMSQGFPRKNVGIAVHVIFQKADGTDVRSVAKTSQLEENLEYAIGASGIPDHEVDESTIRQFDYGLGEPHLLVTAKDMQMSSYHLSQVTVENQPFTDWIRVHVHLGLTQLCLKHIQLSWKPASEEDQEDQPPVDYFSIVAWFELVLAAPFVLLLLPWVRRRRSPGAPFTKIAVLWDFHHHKIWIAMLYISTAVGMSVNILHHLTVTRDINDNWQEFFANIALSVSIAGEILVRLPLHLAHESAERSILANIVGCGFSILYIRRCRPQNHTVRGLDALNALPYILVEGVNLAYFAAHLFKLSFMRIKRKRTIGTGTRFCATQHRDSFATKWHWEYTSDLLAGRGNKLADYHHMESYKPTSIFRHHLSKLSSIKLRVLPVPVLTACLSIVLIASLTILEEFLSLLETHTQNTCTFSHQLPYLNFYFSWMIGVDQPIELKDATDYGSYATALYNAGTVGASVSLTLIVILLVYLLGGITMGFDVDLAKVRRGNYTVVDSRCALSSRSTRLWIATAYMASQVGFGCIGVWVMGHLIMYFFTYAFMLATIPSTWKWVVTIISTFSPFFISFAIAFLNKCVVRIMFFKLFYVEKTGFWIRRPNHGTRLLYFMVPISLVNSALGFFGRLIAGAVALVMYSIRLDATNQLGTLTMFDPAAKVYSAYVLAEHHYNNPIMRTFLDLAMGRINDGVNSPNFGTGYWNKSNARTVAKNRWHVVYTLIHNPQLIVHRRDGRRSPVQLNISMRMGSLCSRVQRILDLRSGSNDSVSSDCQKSVTMTKWV